MANANRVLRAQTPLEQIVDFSKIGQLTQLPQDLYMALSQKAENEEFDPAAEDYKRGETVCVIIVDWQNDFIEGPMAHLGVEGARADSERLFKFIHKYMGGITTILSTVDTHNPQSIFFPTWWINPKTYENPAPFTTIMAKDIEDGIWMPRFKDPLDKSGKTAKEKALAYCRELEANKRPPLTIWPYHCEQGSTGAALECQYFNLQWYHSLARGTSNLKAIKGLDPSSDMYGALKPEFSETNFLNKPLIDAVLNYKYIITCGQARNFCWDTTLVQIVDYFMNAKDPDAYNPDVVKRIIALEDCTSPIGGMTPENIAVEQHCKDCGVQFRKSTDDFSDIFGN